MRRALVVMALVFVAGSSALASGSPALRAVSTQPVKVRGLHFRPGERVTVRLTAEGRSLVRVVRSRSTGRFDVAFKTVSVGKCSRWVVVARGGRGSRATLRQPPFTDCAQP